MYTHTHAHARTQTQHTWITSFYCTTRPLLLDCPNKEVRAAFSQILVTTLHSCYTHQLVAKVKLCALIIVILMLTSCFAIFSNSSWSL